jgi:hypothetical protein
MVIQVYSFLGCDTMQYRTKFWRNLLKMKISGSFSIFICIYCLIQPHIPEDSNQPTSLFPHYCHNNWATKDTEIFLSQLLRKAKVNYHQLKQITPVTNLMTYYNDIPFLTQLMFIAIQNDKTISNQLNCQLSISPQNNKKTSYIKKVCCCNTSLVWIKQQNATNKK